MTACSRRYDPITSLDWRSKPLATLLRMPVRGYGYTLSSLMGRSCRHLPTCSEYMDETLGRHGAWAGGWMGLARLCRCRPGWGGTSGLDPVPRELPDAASSFTPWRYGRWASVETMPRAERWSCDAPSPERDHPSP
ncbi:MAG: membrane protein insertion efficiency factor YidD [Methylocystis sp.]|nr:membrane protein insertion efficiency factor YidD [Methylocystis sp.]MCA3586165.1 membrane protein insertion efficiency factor YidD [Methylocystis sp.]MCA3586595.1 membrane protein insertion efficiency factor YidD [Methylocystis sp.]MCA3592386.1 membrane protein insertion efficiency factor YidD [Methylocystis sp.]